MAAELPGEGAGLYAEGDRLDCIDSVRGRNYRCTAGRADFGLFIRKGVNAVTSRKVPIVGGAILAAASVAPIPFIDSTVVSIVLLSVGYFASQLPSGVIWTLAADIAPGEQVASLGAIQNFGGFLGAALAPVVTGYILDTTGSFNNVFLLGAGLLLLGALSYGVFLKKPIPKLTR